MKSDSTRTPLLIPRAESFGGRRALSWLMRGFGSTVQKIMHEGTLERLTDQGLLIDTEATDLIIDGYEMIVRHRVVPFASYPEEWCPAMLKDAAFTFLDLLVELAHCGLTLKDSHPWNLLFDRGRAVYVDLTSITPIGDEHWRG